MPFDFSALINDPQFQTGIGLMGASNPRNSSMLNAYKIMSAQTMQQAKLKEEASQRELEKKRLELYGAQVEQQGTANKLKKLELDRQQEADDMWTQQVMPMLLNQAQKRFGGGVQPQPGQPAPTPQQQLDSIPEPNFFRQRIIPIEGGTDPKTGAFRTSPKGAIGPAQIMPGTAPKAAQLAGVPFDDNLYRTDPEYNTKIGEALFNHYATVQYGNLPMAAAAYNAGEGALANAVERAKKLGNEGSWLSFMPKETQNYVRQATGGWTGGPIPPSLSGKSYTEKLQQEMEEYKQMKMVMGALIGRTDRKAGATMIADSLKPDTEVPKLQLQAEQGQRDELRLGMERTRVNNEVARTGIQRDAEQRQAHQEQRITEEKAREKQVEKGKAQLAVQQYDEQMKALHDTAFTLRNHPGLNSIVGRFMGSLPPQLLPKDGMDALTYLDQLKGQTFVQGTLAIRQASPTGAGVGNQSNQEGDKLQGAIARLSRAQSVEAFKQALEEVEQLTSRARSNVRGAYEKGWNEKLDLPDVTDTPRQQSGKVGPYSDPEKERRYQEWRRSQGK